MNRCAALILLCLLFSAETRASNLAPLAFGMTPQDAAIALSASLDYVRGRPGSEVFVAGREAGVPGFYPVGERLYLQFRRGRLTGWKTDRGLRRGWLF